MQHRSWSSFVSLNGDVTSLELPFGGWAATFRRREERVLTPKPQHSAPSSVRSLCLVWSLCFFFITVFYNVSQRVDRGRWPICLPWLTEALSHKSVLMGLSSCWHSKGLYKGRNKQGLSASTSQENTHTDNTHTDALLHTQTSSEKTLILKKKKKKKRGTALSSAEKHTDLASWAPSHYLPLAFTPFQFSTLIFSEISTLHVVFHAV